MQHFKIAKKSKSNFSYSFSLLPKNKSDAINIVYAFCRKTDDIVDDDHSRIDEKQLRLNQWRYEFEKTVSGNESGSELLNNLSKVIKEFKIPVSLFFELIAGMEMDLHKNRYATFNELRDYCYKAASTVGLMCIEIFGYNNPKSKEFAINLGIALQLTNILRDIKSDVSNGRIYIPDEDLKKFNYSENDLIKSNYNENFISLMKFECKRAKEFYEAADKSLAEEDKPFMYSAKIMEHIYFRLLKKIEYKNYNVFEGKIRVSTLKKIVIASGIYLKHKLLYNPFHSGLALNGK